MKLLPALLGICLIGFTGLLTMGVYEALTGSPVFPTATPTATPTRSFLSGVEIKVMDGEFGPVTFWQMHDSCEVGDAFGQVPSGIDARTLEDACYQPRQGLYYFRVRTVDGAEGWVREDAIILASEYVSPTPTPTPRPTRILSVTPRPLILPTRKPATPLRSQPRGCCKICTTGKACGDSCISRDKICHEPPGCACNGW